MRVDRLDECWKLAARAVDHALLALRLVLMYDFCFHDFSTLVVVAENGPLRALVELVACLVLDSTLIPTPERALGQQPFYDALEQWVKLLIGPYLFVLELSLACGALYFSICLDRNRIQTTLTDGMGAGRKDRGPRHTDTHLTDQRLRWGNCKVLPRDSCTEFKGGFC